MSDSPVSGTAHRVHRVADGLEREARAGGRRAAGGEAAGCCGAGAAERGLQVQRGGWGAAVPCAPRVLRAFASRS